MKVAFLTNIVSPYRAPVFADLAATEGWDFRVFVSAKTEFDRNWTGDCPGVEVVASKCWSRQKVNVSHVPFRVEQRTTQHIPVGLWGDLSRFQPDVVITHELGVRSVIASLWCRMHRRPMVLWSYQGRALGSMGGRLRRTLRNFVLGTADSVVGMGIQAREVLERFGCEPDRILDAPNATDHRMVAARVREVRAAGRDGELREQLGGGRRIAMVVGRLIPLKGVAETLDAWRRLPADLRTSWQLVFVGGGPLAPLLEAEDLEGVSHVAEVRMDDVPEYLAAADLHVFSSFADVWGLTVNEAMHCGVPTLCSVHAGCTDDLVDETVGFRFDPGSSEDFDRALQTALSSEHLAELGEAAERRGRLYTTDRLAQAFRDSVARARSAGRHSLASA